MGLSFDLGSVHFETNDEGWDKLVSDIVDKELEPRARKIMDRCNLDLIASAIRSGGNTQKGRAQAIIDVGKGFQAGTEGADEPTPRDSLNKRDYRATVITASAAAMYHNAKHHTLIMHLNEGAG